MLSVGVGGGVREMATEIERKFLIVGDEWRAAITGRRSIRQFYLSSQARASVRVRIVDNSCATLTVKSRGAGLTRLEHEYEIPVDDAESMVPLRFGAVIEKVRSDVAFAGRRWEVDEFKGANAGLVIAELELTAERERFALPPWIGAEVTGQASYYNSALASRPFTTWGMAGDIAVSA